MAFGSISQNPNIVVLISDQQRANLGFPDTWIQDNMKNLNTLKGNGITFNQAICNTCRCSPSRSALWTSKYPTATNVCHVGGTLDTQLATLGTVMQQAGYDFAFKGKWHLDSKFGNEASTRPTDPKTLYSEDQTMANDYNMPEWNAPDAGTALGWSKTDTGSINTLGGGPVNNDQRYISGPTLTTEDPNGNQIQQESVRDFLTDAQNSSSPFCLVASLVNPHDVWVNLYSGALSDAYGSVQDIWQNYTGFTLPDSYYNDDLSDKPWIHLGNRNYYSGVYSANNAPVSNDKLSVDQATEYLQFYAYLNTLTDALFQNVYDQLEKQNMLDNTIIVRLADHGEMGMSHGGMMEKDGNIFEETINVPMIFSNPTLFSSAVESDALVGLIDMVPTLGRIAGLSSDDINAYNFDGEDISDLILNPTTGMQRTGILFTYDDGVSVSGTPPSGSNPDAGSLTNIRAIKTSQYKYAVYYGLTSGSGCLIGTQEVDTSLGYQYELYDYINDPDEMDNLANVDGGNVTFLQENLHAQLLQLMNNSNTVPQNFPTVPT